VTAARRLVRLQVSPGPSYLSRIPQIQSTTRRTASQLTRQTCDASDYTEVVSPRTPKSTSPDPVLLITGQRVHSVTQLPTDAGRLAVLCPYTGLSYSREISLRACSRLISLAEYHIEDSYSGTLTPNLKVSGVQYQGRRIPSPFRHFRVSIIDGPKPAILSLPSGLSSARGRI
jgi:hypothetical protein